MKIIEKYYLGLIISTEVFIFLILWPSINANADLVTNYSLRYQRVENLIDGKKSGTTDIKTGIINLMYGDSITPFLRYSLSFNGSIAKQSYEPGSGNSIKETRKYINPIIELTYRLPVYSLRAGYNLNKRWNEKTYQTQINEHHYFHIDLGISPNELPDLYMRYIYNIYKTDTSGQVREVKGQEYQISSSYKYRFRNYLTTEYNASYSHNLNVFTESTFSTGIDRSEKDSINITYKINFYKDYFQRKLNVYTNYKGNYSWAESTVYTFGDGEIVTKVTSLEGLYASGDAVEPEKKLLQTENRLIDGARANSISILNLSTSRYLNIGLKVNTIKSVSKLILYVNKDVRSDPVLLNKNNWKAFYSNANLISTTWTEIPIKSIRAIAYDSINNIYVYEITFDKSYVASYFKIINYALSALPDVLVTEIEAYTSDIIEGDSETTTYKSFIQELSTGILFRIYRNLSFKIDASIRQTDTGTTSVATSFSNLLQNLISKSLPDKASQTFRDVNRTYTANVNWMPNNALNVIIRAQRIANYDSKETKDYRTDSYSAVVGYRVLPGLRTNLSYNFYKNFVFGENTSNTSTATLGLNMMIYPQINMVSDIGYTKADDLVNETQTKTTFLRNSLSMVLTKKIRTYFIYNVTKSSTSNTSSTTTQTFRSTLSYSVGRFMHINGNFSFIKNEEGSPWSTGAGLNWRVLPKIQLNMYYQYSETGETNVHSLSASGTWNISRAMRLRLNYVYSLTDQQTKIESHTLSVYLTGSL